MLWRFKLLINKSSGLVLDDIGSTGSQPTSLVDSSRHKNHGTFTNVSMSQLPSGLWTYGFNGTSSYINCGAAPQMNDLPQFSVECWVKIAGSTGANQYLFNKSVVSAGGWYLRYVNTTNNIVLGTNQTPAASQNTFTAGNIDTYFTTWIHVVAFVDAAMKGHIYINGADATATSGTHITPTGTSGYNLYVGRYNVASSYLNGSIALPKIRNYAIDATFIGKRYNATKHWYARP